MKTAAASHGSVRDPRGTGRALPPVSPAGGTTASALDQPDLLPTVTRMLLAVVAVIGLAYFARSIALPILLAWLGSMILKHPVRWLTQCHLPPMLASALVVSLFFILLSSSALWLGRPALDWVKTAPEQVPKLKEKFHKILQPAFHLSAAASSVSSLDTTTDGDKKVQPVEVRDNHLVGAVFNWTGTFAAAIGIVFGLMFLLLACGDDLIHRFVKVMPTRQDKNRVIELSREIQHSISRYLFTVSVINVGLGIVFALGLSLMNMPNAPMWGAVAALANFIPYLGPAAGMIITGMAGLLAFDTLGRALLPVALYLTLHLIESNLVTPFALGRRFAMNPILIFVALIFCIWLWGVPGALLAVPLLVTLKAVCEHVPALLPLSEFLSR